MKKYILILLLAIFSCKDRQAGNSHREMLFSWYNQSDSLVELMLYRVKVLKGDGSDSIIITSNDIIFCSYKQVIDSSGIYRYCKGEKIKTHSFKDTLITEYCKSKPPFLNENVTYREKKTYPIGKKKFTVYHFIENTGNHTIYDSYFLDEIGPICYYSFDRNDYIFCDSIIGYDISTIELKQIKKELLSDTSFFAKFVLNKLLPNYHRQHVLYNRF